ncbi:MAG: PQQ-binding-like beta-propeller repeat protein [Caldisericia bacterium]
MKNKFFSFMTILFLITNSFLGLVNGLDNQQSSWPMFMKDIRHTGLGDITIDPVKLPKKDDPIAKAQLSSNSKSSPIVANGYVYVGDYNGYLYAFSINDAKNIVISGGTWQPKWTYQTPNLITSAPLYNNGKIYVTSGGDVNKNTGLYAFNATTGEKLWEFSDSTQPQIFRGQAEGSPVFAEGKIIFATNGIESYVYAIDAETGNLIWKFPLSNHGVKGSPCILGGVVYVLTFDGFVYAIDVLGGTAPLASYKIPGITSFQNYSTISTDGNYLYIPVKSQYSYENGKVIFLTSILTFVREFSTNSQFSATTSVGDDSIYIGDELGRFYSIEKNTATIRAGFPFQAGGKIESSAAISGDYIYFGSNDKKIYGLNRRTGVKLWEFETAGEIQSSPAIAEGGIFVVSQDHYLYAFFENDFDISVTPDSAVTYVGGETKFTINITPFSNFSGFVNLSLEGAPQNLVYNFEPQTLSNDIRTSTLTINVNENVPSGTYNLKLVGKSSVSRRIRDIRLSVNIEPYFALNITPESGEVYIGDEIFFNVSFTPYGGFDGIISLSIENPPENIQYEFNPSSISSLAKNSQLTVKPLLNVIPQSYTLRVKGVSGDKIRTKDITIKVKEQIPGTFTLSIQNILSTVYQGETGIYRVYMDAQGGFNEKVKLSVLNLPTGCNYVFQPKEIYSGQTSTLTINTSIDTPPGSYLLTVIGKGGGKSFTTTISLNILIKPTGDFKIEVEPPIERNVTIGESLFFIIKIKRDNIFKDDINLTLEGLNQPLPQGLSYSFNPNKIPSFIDTSYLMIDTSQTMEQTTYTLVIKGESGGKIRTANILIVVHQTTNTNITILPSQVTINSNEIFTIDITINNVENLISANFYLNFDPNLLQIEEIKESAFLGNDGIKPIYSYKIYNLEGYAILQGIRPSQKGISGSGSLFKVTFRGISKGDLKLKFTNLSLFNSSPLFIPCKTFVNDIKILESVGVLGDANGDKIVNGLDLILLMQAFGSTPSDPNWNPNCDFNNDLRINGLDLIILAQNWGKVIP